MNPRTRLVLVAVGGVLLSAILFVVITKAFGWWEGFLKFMEEGDITMWFTLASGVVGLGITFERTYALYFLYSTHEEGLFQKVRNALTKGDTKSALDACQNKPHSALGRLYSVALRNADKSEEIIQDAVDEAGLAVLPPIEARITYLGMIANVATLLGLLGTIIGLIKAFSGLGFVDPSQKQFLLAHGIAIAMHNTALGLLVAIPHLVFQAVLHGRATALLERIDEYTVKLINLLAALQEKRRAGAA
jgi:biopolymer transport protein ExbB/TolQ